MKYATTTLNIQLYKLIAIRREQEILHDLDDNKINGDDFNSLCNSISELEKAIKLIKPNK